MILARALFLHDGRPVAAVYRLRLRADAFALRGPRRTMFIVYHIFRIPMAKPTPYRLHILSLALIVLVSPLARAQQLPTAISDHEFWNIIQAFSEPGGVFQNQLMSNEDSAQFVIPSLKQATRPGGVYIGVGSEQNFTYIAVTKPRLAFIVDIRRENMLEHLIYKALFELSKDRADFVSRLFSRRRPNGLASNASVDALFDAYGRVEPDSMFYESNVQEVIDLLTGRHMFPVSESDKANIASMMNMFRRAGPFNLKGSGDKNISYAQLMTAADLSGRQQSYLASEEYFKTVQSLERESLVIPLVGDFAGNTTIARIGQYIKEHGAIANIFYVSNVERYLFEQGDHARQFYANVRMLPLDRSSVFIRSVTVDISQRLGIPIPSSAANWRSFVVPIRDCLTAFANGRIQSYRDLFTIR